VKQEGEVLQALAHALQKKHYSPKEAMIREGEAGAEMYL